MTDEHVLPHVGPYHEPEPYRLQMARNGSFYPGPGNGIVGGETLLLVEYLKTIAQGLTAILSNQQRQTGLLVHMNGKGNIIMADLSALSAAVDDLQTSENSAIAALNDLSTKLEAGQDITQEDIDAITARISGISSGLRDAVGTADPNPDGDGPDLSPNDMPSPDEAVGGVSTDSIVSMHKGGTGGDGSTTHSDPTTPPTTSDTP